MHTWYVESENQRHHTETTRRDSIQQLVRKYLLTQDAVRRVAILAVVVEKLETCVPASAVANPSLCGRRVCAALWGLGSGNLNRGAYESRKRARHKRKQQQACDVRHLVLTAPAEPHLQRLFHVKTGRANGQSAKGR